MIPHSQHIQIQVYTRMSLKSELCWLLLLTSCAGCISAYWPGHAPEIKYPLGVGSSSISQSEASIEVTWSVLTNQSHDTAASLPGLARPLLALRPDVDYVFWLATLGNTRLSLVLLLSARVSLSPQIKVRAKCRAVQIATLSERDIDYKLIKRHAGIDKPEFKVQSPSPTLNPNKQQQQRASPPESEACPCRL